MTCRTTWYYTPNISNTNTQAIHNLITISIATHYFRKKHHLVQASRSSPRED
ncbi:hypothetical protein HanXRQr2_Chr02g0062981 [Helianthus annuus]|uniref:Uncharacterized protein n=1 Tax=Helianthus annuus TaxID=4232 RepID=A0A9K3JPM1_HELAN|nr:hypothetical protein HanXRQr2_Chr02g0062981 [Helianthus annuus]